MLIKGFLGTSLIDFPGRIASIVFTGGCNFRCPFCHNADLVLFYKQLPTITEEEVLEKIKKRKGFIDGVEITGGEPLLYNDTLDFIKKIKELGYEVKLDTNGYFPDKLEEILNSGIVDFIAMDIKSSPEKYSYACGIEIDLSKIRASISLIMKKAKEYEFRTTVAPKIVEEEDIIPMVKMIEGAEMYALQEFRPVKTIDPSFMEISPYPKENLYHFAEIAKPYVKKIEVRTE